MKPGRFLALAAIAPMACSLTSSLDDLTANPSSDAGADQSLGGGSGGADGGGSGGKGGSGGSGGGVGGTPSGGGTGGATFPDASDPCVSDPDCNGCCASSHSEGQQLFVDAIKKCVCQDPTCATPCATYCTGGTLSTECGTCVASQSVQDCIGTQCGTGQCKIYTDCIGGC